MPSMYMGSTKWIQWVIKAKEGHKIGRGGEVEVRSGRSLWRTGSDSIHMHYIKF